MELVTNKNGVPVVAETPFHLILGRAENRPMSRLSPL